MQGPLKGFYKDLHKAFSQGIIRQILVVRFHTQIHEENLNTALVIQKDKNWREDLAKINSQTVEPPPLDKAFDKSAP